MKRTRQAAILSMIDNQPIETQEELAEALRRQGFDVTQATVSRDIKELRLVKTLGKNGKYIYAQASRAEQTLSDRFGRIFLASVISMEYAGNIVVIKTLAASANVAAEAIDGMRLKEVLGTMAGDNTVLVIVHNEKEARQVTEYFRELLRRG